MQATRIMHELTNLKQGSRSVTEYAGEVKKLYRDLHYYHSFEPVDKKDLTIHHVWFESFVSKLFLDGLNQELDLRHQLIFSKAEWPSLDDIISSVIEEETRLAQPKEDSQQCADARAALSMQPRRVPTPFARWIKADYFVTIVRKKGTQRTHVLSCMATHFGGIKGDLNQGELGVQIKDKPITLHLQGSFHW